MSDTRCPGCVTCRNGGVHGYGGSKAAGARSVPAPPETPRVEVGQVWRYTANNLSGPIDVTIVYPEMFDPTKGNSDDINGRWTLVSPTPAKCKPDCEDCAMEQPGPPKAEPWYCGWGCGREVPEPGHICVCQTAQTKAEPAEWKPAVGDTVEWGVEAETQVGIIHAISAGYAWVWVSTLNRWSVPVADLRRPAPKKKTVTVREYRWKYGNRFLAWSSQRLDQENGLSWDPTGRTREFEIEE